MNLLIVSMFVVACPESGVVVNVPFSPRARGRRSWSARCSPVAAPLLR
jgi:hypothetical protein